MPNCDAHSRSVGNEAAHQPSAEEPRTPENADRGHDIAPSCWMPLLTIMERVLDDFPWKRWFRRAWCKPAKTPPPTMIRSRGCFLETLCFSTGDYCLVLLALLQSAGALDFSTQRGSSERKEFGHWFTLAPPIATKACNKYREGHQTGVELGVVNGGARAEQRIEDPSAAIDLPVHGSVQPCKQPRHDVGRVANGSRQAAQIPIGDCRECGSHVGRQIHTQIIYQAALRRGVIGRLSP